MVKIISNLKVKIVIVSFLIMLLWWVFINLNNLQNVNQNFLYGAGLGLISVIGAVVGILNAKKWGFFKSSMGKAVLFLSIGLLTWGIGTLLFAYYNMFLQVDIPYPSFADLFYIISWPLWALSIFHLSKATGARFQLNNSVGKLLVVIVPIIAIVFSYYILIIVARDGVVVSSTNPLKTFFDLVYPIGDVVILTATLLIYTLSFNFLGGFFKWPIILILLGFAFNYISDFNFVFGVTKGTYFVANWVDLLYTVSFFLLGLGVSMADPNMINVSNKEVSKLI